jgi:hypothetical protein
MTPSRFISTFDRSCAIPPDLQLVTEPGLRAPLYSDGGFILTEETGIFYFVKFHECADITQRPSVFFNAFHVRTRRHLQTCHVVLCAFFNFIDIERVCLCVCVCVTIQQSC